MPDGRNPRPTCLETNPSPIDIGTSCLSPSPTPTPVDSPTPVPAKLDSPSPQISIAAQITAACEKVYDPMSPCNFFVQQVKANLPPPLSAIELPKGQADAMVKVFEEKWTTLKGIDEAMTFASKGAFVIVGLHSSAAALNKTGSPISGTVKEIAKDKISILGADGKQYEYPIPAGATVDKSAQAGKQIKVDDPLMWSKPKHGHVAVIVEGTVEKGAKCYSTNESKKKKYDGKSKGDKKLFGWVFKRDDEKNVKFFTPRDAPDAAKK